MKVILDTAKLKEMFEAYQEVTGKGIPELTRAHARLCCVELANRTQPFTEAGKAGDVIERAKKSLGNEIARAVTSKERMDTAVIQNIDDEKIRTRLQALVSSGKWKVVAKILANLHIVTSPSDFQVISGKDKLREAHQSKRSPRTGHTHGKRGALTLARSGFDSYVTQVLKRVGYSKSGWSECARAIGGLKGDGARGIPAFAKRQRGSNFEVKDNSLNKNDPHFVMTNKTKWLSRILPKSQQEAALHIAKDKMVKSVQMALKAAKKGKRIASETIKNEIEKVA